MHFFNTDFEKAKAIKQIKNFRVLNHVLGKGAFGEVLLAWDTDSKQLVALKLIPQYRLTDNKLQLAFTREIKALNELRHPNIVKVLSIQKTMNNMYIALEFCNGGTLSQLLKYYKTKYSSGIPEALVQRILIQLIDGLSYMHQKGMIHRDMKLDNILITFQSKYYKESIEDYEKSNFEGIQIKIADLGFSRSISNNDCVYSVLGTPINFAPELVNPSHTGYNFLADLWSLGAITYEMIIGTPPFIGKNYDEVMKKINEGLYEYPSNCVVSVESVSFINCLLTYDHNRRMSAEDIRNHQFLTKDPLKFNPMTLNIVPKEKVDNGKICIDSKDNNNFIWVMFRNNGLKEIDKINEDDLRNEEVLKSFIQVKSSENDKEKFDLLSKFRSDRMKKKEKEKEKEKEIEDKDEIKIRICDDKDNDKDNHNENDKDNHNDEYMFNHNIDHKAVKIINNKIEVNKSKSNQENVNNITNPNQNEEININKESNYSKFEKIDFIKETDYYINQSNINNKENDIIDIDVNWDTYSIVDDKVDIEVLSDYTINMEYIKI